MIVRLIIGSDRCRANMTRPDGLRYRVRLSQRSADMTGDQILVYAEVTHKRPIDEIEITRLVGSSDYWKAFEEQGKESAHA